MSVSERLAYLITANADQAITTFEKVGKTADKDLGKADARLDKLGGRATVAGAGMLAFAGVAGVALAGFARQSEDANKSQVLLTNTLGNMPKLAGENKNAFNDLAQAIQHKTAADGDQIVAAEAMLGTFNLTGKEIRDVTPLVVDFAQKFGVDMTAAAIQVGKALDGQVGALKRNGVSIDENLFKTDRFAAVTQALRNQVGGFAEQEGKTFSGRLQRLKNDLGDVQEGIGSGVIGAVEKAVGPVAALSEKFGSLDEKTQSNIGSIGAYATGTIGAVGALSLMAGQVIKLRNNFTSVDEAGVRTLTTMGRVATGIGLVGGGVTAIFAVKAGLDAAGLSAKGLDIDLQHLSQTGTRELAREFNKLEDSFAGTKEALHAFDVIAENNIGTAKRLRDELAGQGRDVTDLDGIIHKHIVGQKQVKTDTENATGAIEGESAALQTNTDRAKEAADAINGLVDATLGAFDAGVAYRESLNATEDALQAYKDKALEVIATHGKSKEANEAAQRAGLDLESAYLHQAAAAAAAAEKTALMSGKSFDASDKARIEKEELLKLAGTLAPGSDLRKHLDEYIFQLGLIPKSVTTNLDLQVLGNEGAARGAADAFGGLRLNPQSVKSGATIHATINNYGVKDGKTATTQSLRDAAHLYGW